VLQDLWLTCPLPADKNALYGVSPYRAKRWVFLYPEVVQWRMAQRLRWLVDLRAADPAWRTHDEPWEVEIHAHLEVGSAYGDIDHYVSNVLDTLVSVLYTDDCWVEHVVLTRTRDVTNDEPYVDIFASLS
jgi:hypothetical protein